MSWSRLSSSRTTSKSVAAMPFLPTSDILTSKPSRSRLRSVSRSLSLSAPRPIMAATAMSPAMPDPQSKRRHLMPIAALPCW